MLYVLDTEIKENIFVYLALQTIFGLGKVHSIIICKKLGFGLNYKISQMSTKKIENLKDLLEKIDILLASELKKSQSLWLKNLISIKSYRGLRRLLGFPVRGQRTHTNAKTSRRVKR